jgi:hypothetical protein
MIRTLLLGMWCIALPASELVIRDIRLGLGTGSADYDYTVSGNTVDDAGSDTWTGALAFELGGRWSFARPGSAFGLVVGVDAVYETLRDDDGDLTTYWGRGTVGLGWAASDYWTLTAAIGGRIGRSTLDEPASTNANSFTAHGSASGYDLRIEAVWRLSRRWCVGFDAGWLIANHDMSGDALTVSVDRSGWAAGLVVLWRLTNAPTPLH